MCRDVSTQAGLYLRVVIVGRWKNYQNGPERETGPVHDVDVAHARSVVALRSSVTSGTVEPWRRRPSVRAAIDPRRCTCRLHRTMLPGTSSPFKNAGFVGISGGIGSNSQIRRHRRRTRPQVAATQRTSLRARATSASLGAPVVGLAAAVDGQGPFLHDPLRPLWGVTPPHVDDAAVQQTTFGTSA